MMVIALSSFLLLLYILVFFVVWNILRGLVHQSRKRARLHHRKSNVYVSRFEQWLYREIPIYRKVDDMLKSVHWSIHPFSFLIVSICFMCTGSLIGALLFVSIKGALSLSFIAGLFPFLLLHMKLISNRMKIRMEFLPAVELFYQQYVLGKHRNLRVVLQEVVQESRLHVQMKPVFELLDRQLSTNVSVDDCLRVFKLSLGHDWAKYFANIFAIGLTEGIDIADKLKQLITDMRKAQRQDQAERNRLLEIRIANFTPILFLVAFLTINYKLDPQQAVHYYLYLPEGRNLILDALLLIFLSFLMGVYLSMKKI